MGDGSISVDLGGNLEGIWVESEDAFGLASNPAQSGAWRASKHKSQMMSFTASGSRGSLFIDEMATYGDEFHFDGFGGGRWAAHGDGR